MNDLNIIKVKLIFLAIFTTASTLLFAQDTLPVLFIELAYGFNSYSMDQWNEHYIDGYTAQDNFI